MRFADYGKRVVFTAIDGGEITSDAGVLLLMAPLCHRMQKISCAQHRFPPQSLGQVG